MKKVLSLLLALSLLLISNVFATEEVFEGPQPKTYGTLLAELQIIPEATEEITPISKEEFVNLILAVSPHKSLLETYNPPSTPTFVDVSSDNPYFKSIEFANALKLIGKNAEGKFGLAGPITIDEALKAVAINLGVPVNQIPADKTITAYMYENHYYDFTFFKNLDHFLTKGEAYSIAYLSIEKTPQGRDKTIKEILGFDKIKSEKDFRRDSYIAYIPHPLDLEHYFPVVNMKNPDTWNNMKSKAIEINQFNTELINLVTKLKASNLEVVNIEEIKPLVKDNFVSFTSYDLYQYNDGTTVSEYEITSQSTFMLPSTKTEALYYEVMSSEGMGGGELSIIDIYKTTIDNKAHYMILLKEHTLSPYKYELGMVVLIPEKDGTVTTIGDLSYGKGKGNK